MLSLSRLERRFFGMLMVAVVAGIVANFRAGCRLSPAA